VSAWKKIDDLRERVAARALVEINAADHPTPKTALDVLEKAGWSPDRLVVLGWEILLSRRKQDGTIRWHLSAKLHPHGRSASSRDWEILDRIAARVGAPHDPLRLSQDPSAPLHWMWTEQ